MSDNINEIIEGLKEFDSPTVFNAMVEKLGLPNEDYTSHEIRYLSPEFGTVVGWAVTAEVTTNDPDSPRIEWIDFYEHMNDQEAPFFTVMKDVDSRPGRGACFGDGMARLYKRLGAVGAILDGSARDLAGIRAVGLPIWGWGTVPGHGVFNLTRFNEPVTIGQTRIRPGDLILADADGCVRVPIEHAEDILRLAGEVRANEAAVFGFYDAPDFTMDKLRERFKR